MPEDIIRNGSGAGYGEKKAEALPPHLPAVPSVPPMEAEWLRVVGGRPGGVGDSRGPNGAGHNGTGQNGAAPKGPARTAAARRTDSPPAKGNGPPNGGVDSTRGGS